MEHESRLQNGKHESKNRKDSILKKNVEATNGYNTYKDSNILEKEKSIKQRLPNDESNTDAEIADVCKPINCQTNENKNELLLIYNHEINICN